MKLPKIILVLMTGAFSLLNAHTKFLEREIYTKPVINKIPKIIHQIWVGKKEIPPKYITFMEGWKKLHPDWEYKLWTDQDIDSFPWEDKDTFLKAKNPAMKGDIWGYEIIYKYGGVYIDCDMECIRPLDPIHERLTSYFGWDSPSKEVIAASIYAGMSGSLIYKKFINLVSSNLSKIHDVATISKGDQLSVSGPNAMTNVIRPNKKLFKKNDIIFSHEYFQPVSCGNGGIPRTDQEKFDVEHSFFAIHHNGCSWTGEEFFPNK
jgi:hypothetical protein